MTATTTLQAGDKVIIRKEHGAAPTTDTVAKVTPKGRIYVSSRPDFQLKEDKYSRGKYEPVAPGYGEKYLVVCPYNEGILAEWRADHERAEARKAEKQAERDAHRAAVEARQAEELATVKAALGGNVYATVRYQNVLPCGDRMVLLHLPTKAELAERKGPVEVVMVRLRREKDTCWTSMSEVERVAAYYTYASAANSSFPSCSGERFDTEEQALWAVARSVYHSW